MGSSRNKMLNQQEALARQQYQQSFQQAQQQSPAEKALQERNLSFLNWMDTPGRDVTAAPGISPYLQIGKAAQERASRQRMGMGAMQLGTGSEGYAAKLREQYAQEAAQNYGGGLEQAVAGRYAEATGALPALMNASLSRNAMLTQSAQGNLQSYMNAPRETPFWKTLVQQGIQAGATIASGGLSAGGIWNKGGSGSGGGSDIRLKSNIHPSLYGLAEVLQMQPVAYVMDGTEQIGFIAQDIEKIMPEFVIEIGGGYKGLMYGNMVAVMAKAIQELNAKVEQHNKKGIVRKLLSSCISWLKSKV